MKQPNNDKYQLIRTDDFLGVINTDEKSAKPFYIDFLAQKMAYRAGQASLRKERLARALGCKPKEEPVIIDATAGLGRDSFILACLGYHVTMLEQSEIIYTLLDDALSRARQSTADHPCQRLTLIHTEACAWLRQTNLKPDIIYLDPMFPARKKSAAVKKEMQIMADLLGHDHDISQLLEVSLACAAKRVVVKRPRLATNLHQRQPDFSIKGTSTRFDIYLVK